MKKIYRIIRKVVRREEKNITKEERQRLEDVVSRREGGRDEYKGEREDI